MAVIFPTSPTVGQQYTDVTSNTKFVWTGTYWRGAFTPGSKGDKGEIGTKGDQGIPGTAVAKGDKGEVGPTGDKGDIGAKGDIGTKGDIGPAPAKNLYVYTRSNTSIISLGSTSYVTIVGRDANTNVNLTL